MCVVERRVRSPGCRFLSIHYELFAVRQKKQTRPRNSEINCKLICFVQIKTFLPERTLFKFDINRVSQADGKHRKHRSKVLADADSFEELGYWRLAHSALDSNMSMETGSGVLLNRLTLRSSAHSYPHCMDFHLIFAPLFVAN